MFDRSGSRKYLNRRERLAFWRAANGERDILRRSFALTLFFTGCRISEALNLRVERADIKSMTITFETLKRRKRGIFRSVPIPPELGKLLEKITRGRSPTDRVWKFSRPTGYRLITEHMHRAKIVGGMACPKGLRHGFGVACVAEKIPSTTIQKWLGHASLKTTAIYLTVLDDEERALAKRLWSMPKSRRKSSCKNRRQT